MNMVFFYIFMSCFYDAFTWMEIWWSQQWGLLIAGGPVWWMGSGLLDSMVPAGWGYLAVYPGELLCIFYHPDRPLYGCIYLWLDMAGLLSEGVKVGLLVAHLAPEMQVWLPWKFFHYIFVSSPQKGRLRKIKFHFRPLYVSFPNTGCFTNVGR